MDLLAREAGDRFIGRFIGLHFLGGPTLHVLACIRAAIKERRHRKITVYPALSYVKRLTKKAARPRRLPVGSKRISSGTHTLLKSTTINPTRPKKRGPPRAKGWHRATRILRLPKRRLLMALVWVLYASASALQRCSRHTNTSTFSASTTAECYCVSGIWARSASSAA